MKWEIRTTDTFDTWFISLSQAEQVDVLSMIDVLEISGPQLGRPQADSIQGSKKVRNLKELRISHAGKPYRVFYAFDPKRRAVLLCGGRKDGSKDKQFYSQMISVAEHEFAVHLAKVDAPEKEQNMAGEEKL